jgi:hypothetical protein
MALTEERKTHTIGKKRRTELNRINKKVPNLPYYIQIDSTHQILMMGIN